MSLVLGRFYGILAISVCIQISTYTFNRWLQLSWCLGKHYCALFPNLISYANNSVMSLSYLLFFPQQSFHSIPFFVMVYSLSCAPLSFINIPLFNLYGIFSPLFSHFVSQFLKGLKWPLYFIYLFIFELHLSYLVCFLTTKVNFSTTSIFLRNFIGFAAFFMFAS